MRGDNGFSGMVETGVLVKGILRLLLMGKRAWLFAGGEVKGAEAMEGIE